MYGPSSCFCAARSLDSLSPKDLHAYLRRHDPPPVDPTLSYLAGVDGSDDPPEPPREIDPANPAADIYGNHSWPKVDGVNIWGVLMNPSGTNRSSAHEYLVLSKEVVVAGRFKLLVGQNTGSPYTLRLRPPTPVLFLYRYSSRLTGGLARSQLTG